MNGDDAMTDKQHVRTGALYIRVSTGKQEELSPDAQRRLLLEYAQKNNILISNQFIYEEDGISGRKADKRPKFMDMIAHAKSKDHPFDVILVWKYSRFARNQEESIVYKSMLKRDNVEVISISEPLIDGPFGSLIERIIEWMDEYYSIRLSGEVFRGMTENALRGKYQARPPLGYKVMHKKEAPVIVEDEAKIIHLIFDMYTKQGASMYDIARHLNALGYKTSHGKNFERRSIEYILMNPTYIGKTVWNRHMNADKSLKDSSEWIIADGSHEAIISPEQFAQAKSRYESEYHPKKQRPASVQKHWLSGLIKCSACGRTLSVSSHMDKRYGRRYTNFQCYGYLKGKCHESHNISEIKLIPRVLDGLNAVLEQDTVTFSLLEPVSSEPDGRIYLTDQLEQIAKKELRIKQAYRDGIDTLDEYKENKAILIKEKEAIQQKLNAIPVAKKKSTRNYTALMKSKIQSVIDVVSNDTVDMITKNEAMKSIVEKIVYDKQNDSLNFFFYLQKPL